MFNRLILVIVLVVAFCIPLGGTAYGAGATINTTFTMQPSVAQVGESVTLTDTTVNPTGLPLIHSWSIYEPGGNHLQFGAGDSHCIDPDCSRVQLIPTQAGRYNIAASDYNDATSFVGSTEHLLAVFDATHPLPFQLISSPTIELPATIEVLSLAPKALVSRCTATAWIGTYWDLCDPYLLKRTGPDSAGQYRFLFRLAVGPTGPVELQFVAEGRKLAGSESQELIFNVTSSSKQFDYVGSCYKGNGAYSVIYYYTSSSMVMARLQVRRGRHWVTLKRSAHIYVPDSEPTEADFFGNPSPEKSPWFHRYLYSNFGPASSLGPERRILVEIRHGGKLIKRDLVSKKPCNKLREF